ncbi:MAG TPA: N-acetylmuramidase domain-containing protein [Methylomirabilota bacterium]|nr:N-acetylmuramidase domain-containing protein [Methylomirabilota bacterium]
MATTFQGAGQALDAAGVAAACDTLGVHAAELWAVLTVETRGCGFLPDRRPLILFERHYFSRLTRKKYDAKAPDISNPKWGGYHGGASEYDRLDRALKLDRPAALRSASWGLGQVMGDNFKAAGFSDVEAMVAAFVKSENAQLQGMARFIGAIGADKHLRAHNWPAFAAAYNGPAYAQNSYDERLRAAHQKYMTGALPDLDVRAIQANLVYLGYNPGPVDGVVGRFTRSALAMFQEKEGIPVREIFDADMVKAVCECVARQ